MHAATGDDGHCDKHFSAERQKCSIQPREFVYFQFFFSLLVLSLCSHALKMSWLLSSLFAFGKRNTVVLYIGRYANTIIFKPQVVFNNSVNIFMSV